MTHTFFFDDVSESCPAGRNPMHVKGRTNPGSATSSTTTTSVRRACSQRSRIWRNGQATSRTRWWGMPPSSTRLLTTVLSMMARRSSTVLPWYVRHSRGREVITHSGADAGFRALFAYYPAEDFAVAITANTDVDPGASDAHLDLQGKVAAIDRCVLAKNHCSEAASKWPRTPTHALWQARSFLPMRGQLKLEVEQRSLYQLLDGTSHPESSFNAPDGSFDAGKPQSSFFVPIKDASGRVTRHRPTRTG